MFSRLVHTEKKKVKSTHNSKDHGGRRRRRSHHVPGLWDFDKIIIDGFCSP